MANVLALKEEGTTPPVEGVLSKFSEIQGIRSTDDVRLLAQRHFDILLVDTSMPRIEAQDVVRALRSSGSASNSLILLFDFNESPSEVRRRLGQLAKLNPQGVSRRPHLRAMLRLLNLSQESLARMLNVSSRTAHRWLGKTKPRNNPQLRRLQRLVELLIDTLQTDRAIQEYLNHPNPGLGGETPIAVLGRGEFGRVEADLQALREGVYV